MSANKCDGVKLASGYTAYDLDDDVMAQYEKDFLGSAAIKVIKVNPGGWVFPKPFLNFEKKLYNFKFRPDDVVVMTYPKCGTTWTQEIVWTMRNNPDLDKPEQATEAIFMRSPFIDMDMLFPQSEEILTEIVKEPIFEGFHKWCPGKKLTDGIMLQLAAALPSPRILKTHLPFSFFQDSLLDTCKVICVARNPKDVVLSYMHHCRLIQPHGFTGDQDCFVKYFVENMLFWDSYAEHLKEAWKHRQHPNLHWIFYEDMKADIGEELKKLDSFLGTGLTDQQLENVQQHTSFGSMKIRDPMKMMKSNIINRKVAQEDGDFIRKGEVGGWRGALTPHQEELIDAYVTKHFRGLGINFKYH